MISGYHAHIDPRVIGRPLVALIDVKLAPTTKPETFERILNTIAPVREHTFLTGRFDYQLLVTCKNTADLDQVLRTLRSENGVAETETRVVLRGPTRNRRDRQPAPSGGRAPTGPSVTRSAPTGANDMRARRR